MTLYTIRCHTSTKSPTNNIIIDLNHIHFRQRIGFEYHSKMDAQNVFSFVFNHAQERYLINSIVESMSKTSSQNTILFRWHHIVHTTKHQIDFQTMF